MRLINHTHATVRIFREDTPSVLALADVAEYTISIHNRPASLSDSSQRPRVDTTFAMTKKSVDVAGASMPVCVHSVPHAKRTENLPPVIEGVGYIIEPDVLRAAIEIGLLRTDLFAGDFEAAVWDPSGALYGFKRLLRNADPEISREEKFSVTGTHSVRIFEGSFWIDDDLYDGHHIPKDEWPTASKTIQDAVDAARNAGRDFFDFVDFLPEHWS